MAVIEKPKKGRLPVGSWQTAGGKGGCASFSDCVPPVVPPVADNGRNTGFTMSKPQGF